MSNTNRAVARVAAVQGAYFLVTGLWPIVHLRSFTVVTGPKLEGWLVKTVGAMIAVTGLVLLDAARRGVVDRSATMLGVGTSAALGVVDVVYPAKRRISPVYLLDAVVELGVLVGWALTRPRRPRAAAR